ncbi:cyclic nucleotide-gated ion channel 1-like [Mercurialis annua]|uniref:cyclic nucleotide-gated ion channel 1-like n=1 Tax=Mercurialis annua TaxID=3986 RepID=UPI0021602290|nr:cyclic nucleotide-gated ion channel 1-like [Mercurialis annua]
MECWQVIVARKRVFDPQEPFLRRCNKIFLVCCAVSVSLDPLFFYVPEIDNSRKCLRLDKKLETVAATLRCALDIFYIFHIILQFHTGFYARSHIVVARSDLVVDSWMIARRYLKLYFLIDILATLPLPQVAIFFIIPKMGGSNVLNTKNLLKFIVSFQLVPRLLRFGKLFQETVNSSNGRSGLSRNRVAVALTFYIWAAHVLGGFWYLFAIGREMDCWQAACGSHAECNSSALDCNGLSKDEYYQKVHMILNTSCPTDFEGGSPFDFGIFINAHNSGILESTNIWLKLMYCFWWSLQNLSTLGQNLKTSTSVLEIFFALAIFVCGLVLVSLVIGIIQETMLSMMSSRIATEKMKMKWQEVESWMDTHFLPDVFREDVRRNQQLKWEKNQVLDADNLLNNLPSNLRRDITRHLCGDIIKKAQIFEDPSEQLVDAICERLKQTVYAEKIYVRREGDLVDEIVFIIRGELLSIRNSSDRNGLFSSVYLKAGDLLGEEVVSWALNPISSVYNLPISTSSVRTHTEVEVFVLKADDLKFLIAQFKLHRKQQYVPKLYSQYWRTRAACLIQAAWRRSHKNKPADFLLQEDNRMEEALAKTSRNNLLSLGATMYASRFAANALRTHRHTRICEPSLTEKPAEPSFTAKEHYV